MEKHTNEVEDNQMRALSWKTRVAYGLGDPEFLMDVLMLSWDSLSIKHTANMVNPDHGSYGWRFHMQYRQYYYSQYHILQLTYS